MEIVPESGETFGMEIQAALNDVKSLFVKMCSVSWSYWSPSLTGLWLCGFSCNVIWHSEIVKKQIFENVFARCARGLWFLRFFWTLASKRKRYLHCQTTHNIGLRYKQKLRNSEKWKQKNRLAWSFKIFPANQALFTWLLFDPIVESLFGDCPSIPYAILDTIQCTPLTTICFVPDSFPFFFKEPKAKTQRNSGNNGDFDEVPAKRARPSPKDESKIDSTSEFEPYVPSSRRNPVELLLNRPQIVVSISQFRSA